MNFFEATFVSYALTFLITMSHVMEPFRDLVRKILTKLDFGFAVEEYDFITCRMCVGAWVGLALALIFGDYLTMFAAYGASYFLATQERP